MNIGPVAAKDQHDRTKNTCYMDQMATARYYRPYAEDKDHCKRCNKGELKKLIYKTPYRQGYHGGNRRHNGCKAEVVGGSFSTSEIVKARKTVSENQT